MSDTNENQNVVVVGDFEEGQITGENITVTSETLNGSTISGTNVTICGTEKIIDDTSTSKTKVWSADKVNSSLAELQTERSYSTEEHFTGKYWIDGKKIYEKTFILSSIGSEFTEFDSGISNLSDLITWEGNLQTATQIYSINRYQADFYYNKATHKFTYQSQTTLSFTRGNISITYTKTTD